MSLVGTIRGKDGLKMTVETLWAQLLLHLGFQWMKCVICRCLSVLFGGYVCDLRNIFLQAALLNDNFLIMSESMETFDLSAILNVAVDSNFNSISQAATLLQRSRRARVHRKDHPGSLPTGHR
jgi:hypothetical protein